MWKCNEQKRITCPELCGPKLGPNLNINSDKYFIFIFNFLFCIGVKLTIYSWCFWTVVLDKTLESPLDFKEIQPVNPKGNQSWIFIERTDAEAEAPILWPPDVKSWLIRKDPDAGQDWRLEEKGMVGWHHWLDRHECNQALGVGDGQGRLASCSP